MQSTFLQGQFFFFFTGLVSLKVMDWQHEQKQKKTMTLNHPKGWLNGSERRKGFVGDAKMDRFDLLICSDGSQVRKACRERDERGVKGRNKVMTQNRSNLTHAWEAESTNYLADFISVSNSSRDGPHDKHHVISFTTAFEPLRPHSPRGVPWLPISAVVGAESQSVVVT